MDGEEKKPTLPHLHALLLGDDFAVVRCARATPARERPRPRPRSHGLTVPPRTVGGERAKRAGAGDGHIGVVDGVAHRRENVLRGGAQSGWAGKAGGCGKAGYLDAALGANHGGGGGALGGHALEGEAAGQLQLGRAGVAAHG